MTTIIHGLFTVPLVEQYVFKRSPEIMDWFATLGYGFHDRHDADGPYASIVYSREQAKDFGFANSISTTDILRKGGHLPGHFFDITPLIEAHLQHATTYEYW